MPYYDPITKLHYYKTRTPMPSPIIPRIQHRDECYQVALTNTVAMMCGATAFGFTKSPIGHVDSGYPYSLAAMVYGAINHESGSPPNDPEAIMARAHEILSLAQAGYIGGVIIDYPRSRKEL